MATRSHEPAPTRTLNSGSSIDSFTRVEFEAALPVDKVTGNPLWSPLGLVNAEYTYLVPVAKVPGIGILIRSSIDSTGYSAGLGKDSIRAYLVDMVSHKPVYKKLTKWTTRLPGWPARLHSLLRKLYLIALCLRCPACGHTGLISDKLDGKGPFFYDPRNKGGCGKFTYINLKELLKVK